MMMKAVANINWTYPGDAIPAFITLLCMPLTYSIAYGLIAGIVSYILLNTTAWLIEIASGGRIVPYAKELKDPWTHRIAGGFFPSWIVRLFRGKADFWRPDEELDEESQFEMPSVVGGTSEKEFGEPGEGKGAGFH
jgi:AGZA family xanthine/uracil permease-like MFS transporter